MTSSGPDPFGQYPGQYPQPPYSGQPPYPQYPPFPQQPPPSRRAASGVVLTMLAALLGGYLLAGFLTRSLWLTGPQREGVEVTLSAKTSDGSAPSAMALAQTRDTVEDRLVAAGVADPDVTFTDTGLTVIAAADDGLILAVTRPGQLYVRPVIHAVSTHQAAAAAPPGAPVTPGAPGKPDFEKELRQSANPNIQLLALQYQAGRCGQDDVLAGNDDPHLPLVTCSTDGQSVYLLGPSIISGAQVQAAAVGHDTERGRDVVDVTFDTEAATIWMNYTAANIGTQTAFTVDTRVVSAPAVQEAIPGGQTQITGFYTAETARDFAAALHGRPLPLALTVTSSEPKTFPGQPGSTTVRAILIGTGVLLLALTAGGIWYLARRRT